MRRLGVLVGFVLAGGVWVATATAAPMVDRVHLSPAATSVDHVPFCDMPDAPTLASGDVEIGAALSGSRGSIRGGQLEQSNVDIAHEFTQMILAQRGYQASSKGITVADELLVETLNLKR